MATFGNPVYSFTPEALSLVGEARLAYVRKVYSYFFVAVLSAIAGTMISFQSSLALSFAQMPILGIVIYFGMFFAARKTANNPMLAVPTLSTFTFVSGMFIAPVLFAMAHGYIRGSSVDTIYDALILTGAIFAGLTGYVWVTKKDFSYLGASLAIGLFLVFGVILVNIFVGSAILDLSISIVGVLLFSGFILYDTSRILRRAHETPATMAALSLYLDFLNLFMMLLRILGGGRRR